MLSRAVPPAFYRQHLGTALQSITLPLAGIFSKLDHGSTPVVISLLLLLLETGILVLVFREGRERRRHISALNESTRELHRAVYVSTIEREALKAKERIYCYWHSLHPAKASEDYKAINDRLIDACKASLDVKLVIAKDTARIAGAYELAKEGVPIFFQDTLLFSDLRFSIFDAATTVFGMPESALNSGKPSRHGWDIKNHKLAALMADHFRDEFRNAKTYEEFVAAETYNVLKDPTNTMEMVAEELGITAAEIERCQCAAPDACTDKDDSAS